MPLGVKKTSIREKSMQPRFFVFCSYLPKKLSGDVLAPSGPFWTLRSSLRALRGYLGVLEVRYIHEKLMRPRFLFFCSSLPKKLSGDVLAPSGPSLDPTGHCKCP